MKPYYFLTKFLYFLSGWTSMFPTTVFPAFLCLSLILSLLFFFEFLTLQHTHPISSLHFPTSMAYFHTLQSSVLSAKWHFSAPIAWPSPYPLALNLHPSQHALQDHLAASWGKRTLPFSDEHMETKPLALRTLAYKVLRPLGGHRFKFRISGKRHWELTKYSTRRTVSTQATQMKWVSMYWNDLIWNLMFYMDLKDWLQMSLTQFPQALHTTVWNVNLFANTPQKNRN